MRSSRSRIIKVLTSRVALHLYFWIVYFSAEVYLDYDLLGFHASFFRNLINLPLNIIPVYTALYLILPQIVKRNYLKAFSIFAVLLFVTVGYTYLDIFELMHVSMGVPFTPWSFRQKVFTLLYYNIAVPSIPLAIKLGKKWYFEQREKAKLQLENTEARLHLLRAQVNPHFLFNSLNNISSLAHISGDKTQESIIMLSELMRYMVYEGNSDEVLLNEEISYIRNYISLQKIRIDQKDYISIKENGDFSSHYIAPMLLIPFIENAFKYSDKQQTPGIWINYSIEGDKFNFEIKNRINNSLLREVNSNGFGIRNVRNRLNLIYPGKHSLVFDDAKDFYTTKLNITLPRNEKNILPRN